MEKVMRQILLLTFSFCAMTFISFYEIEELIFIMIFLFVMGYVVKIIIDNYTNAISFLPHCIIIYIILNSAYYTLIVCIHTSFIFILVSLISMLSGYCAKMLNTCHK